MESKGLSIGAGVLAVVLLVLWATLGKPTSTGAAQASVTIVNSSFSPATIAVPMDTAVVWTNQDGFAHTTTSEQGVWDSGALGTGQSFSFSFTSPGAFPYFCAIHTFMRGTVIVEAPAPTPTDTPLPTATPTESPTATPVPPTATPPSASPTATPTPAGMFRVYLPAVMHRFSRGE